MTPEQQQAAARVAVHQLRNAKQMLFQAALVVNQLLDSDYVTIAEYVARGVDAILFDDATESGAEHKTLRLLSDRALAAVAVAV